MKFLTKIILTVLFLGVTLFAKDVATITAINGEAFVERDGVKSALILGYKLQEKDTVLTSDKSKVQIIFSDETVVTVGKKSNFSINEYLFEDGNEPVAKFGMLKGAMRTITGKIGKIAPDKFSVKTKTATIGIRGTNFTILEGDDGSQRIYCTFGAISVTVNGQEVIVEQGFYVYISPEGKVEVKEFDADELKNAHKKVFGKSSVKRGKANQDSEYADNSGQLDNTREDYNAIVVKDISEQTQDASQREEVSSLADILAGYTMSDALYTGTIVVTEVGGSGMGLQTGDEAQLAVDFGNDTATLTLGAEAAKFSTNPSFSGTDFSLDEDGGTGGDASGTFNGDTGNNVTGDFYHTDGTSYYDRGTFDVSTSQELH